MKGIITGLLDGLERSGMIARQHDAVDRRKLLISLTPSGESLTRDLFSEHSSWIASLFNGFDGKSRDALSDLLQRAWRNVDVDSANAQQTTSGDLP